MRAGYWRARPLEPALRLSARRVHSVLTMTRLLFRIGTLALLTASVAPANVSHRYARNEPRDQGRPHSRRTYCRAAGTLAGDQHGRTAPLQLLRTPIGRIQKSKRLSDGLKQGPRPKEFLNCNALP